MPTATVADIAVDGQGQAEVNWQRADQILGSNYRSGQYSFRYRELRHISGSGASSVIHHSDAELATQRLRDNRHNNRQPQDRFDPGHHLWRTDYGLTIRDPAAQPAYTQPVTSMPGRTMSPPTISSMWPPRTLFIFLQSPGRLQARQSHTGIGSVPIRLHSPNIRCQE